MSTVVPNPPRISDRDFRRGNRRRRRSRRRARHVVRRVLIGLGIAIPVVALLGLLAIVPAASAKTHLENGRSAIEKAQSALLAGDVPQASEQFASAESEFRAAVSAGDNPLLRIPAFVPFIGRTPDAVRTIADVGLRVSTSGKAVTDAISRLPGGFDSLAPTSGKIPVEQLLALAPVVSQARQQFEDAAREADGIATTMVPAQVVQAGDLLRAKLDQALPVIRAADGMIKALPTFAGLDGAKHYFLAPQNPTELRGTGGLISAYAILTIDNGAISVGPFEDIRSLQNVGHPTWPTPELQRLYEQQDSAGFWRSTNFTPDAPTASLFMENLWNETHDTPIDGVILVDVQTLQYLLKAVGSVQAPGVPYSLDDRNVVKFVAHDAYDLIKNDTARKDFVGIVGQVIFQDFLQNAHGDAALRALVQAAADGHLIVNASDRNVEQALAAAGITGAMLPADATDFFSTVVNNQAANKVDYFVKREIRYDVTLLPDGRATVRAAVTFDNTAPAGAKPSYMLGPSELKLLRPLALEPGEAFQDATFYCGEGCEVASSTRDGQAFPMLPNVEQGLSLFTRSMRLPAQASSTVDLSLDLPEAWDGSNAIGDYRLAIRSQPTIVPTAATVVVHVPSGTSVSYASEDMKVEGSTATWTGRLGDLTTFEVRFSRGLIGRIWSNVSDFLSKPVIRFGD